MFLRSAVILIFFSFLANADDRDSDRRHKKSYLQTQNDLAPLLSEQEKSYIATSKPLVVCSIRQASGSAASIDVVDLITAHSGLELIASPTMSWQEGLDSLKKKTSDILPWATETKQRRSVMNFTRPYARIIRVIITRQEQPYISDISQYSDQLFVVEKNNHIVNQLQKYYPNLRTINSDHTIDALNLVDEKKAFASISSLYSVGNLFNSLNLSELKIAGRLPSNFDDVVSLATRKDDILLHEILNKSVLTLNPKSIQEFMSQGAIFTYQPKINYSRLWLIGGITLVVFILLVWWNRYLAQLNRKLEKAHTELKIKSKLLEVLSVTDPLTDTFNRIKMDRVFDEEIERSSRYGQPLSVIMIDVDYFKHINDRHGHLVGDQVLQKFAFTLKSCLRANDILGRWGGEEFLLICPNISLHKAQITAEKLRALIEETNFSPAEKLTASFGVSNWCKGETQQAFIAKADYAMYLAKHQGRNKVCLSTGKP